MSVPADPPPPAAPTAPRELTRAEADEFLHSEVVGRIGCHHDGLTYVVPIYFAYDGESVHVYSLEGQKLRMMRANPSVCFEVDRYEGPGRWRSVVAHGRFEELDAEGAERARELLVAKVGGGPARRPRADAGSVVAFRIRFEQLTGRALEAGGS